MVNWVIYTLVVFKIKIPFQKHNFRLVYLVYISPGSDKSACNAGRPRFNPWVRKILWRRGWLPTSVFLSGEFYAQRRLAGYSPWGCKEVDTTECLIHMFESGRRELIQEGSEIFKSTLHRTQFFFERLVNCWITVTGVFSLGTLMEELTWQFWQMAHSP